MATHAPTVGPILPGDRGKCNSLPLQLTLPAGVFSMMAMRLPRISPYPNLESLSDIAQENVGA